MLQHIVEIYCVFHRKFENKSNFPGDEMLLDTIAVAVCCCCVHVTQ